MIKRPLHRRFTEAVISDRKIPPIRETPWPVGVPIMLYRWAGAPYRSKHVDVAVIEVVKSRQIEIRHSVDGQVEYAGVGLCGTVNPIFLIMSYPHTLWSAEGFDSQEDMDAWFRAVVKPGQTNNRHWMQFNRVKRDA